MAHNELAIGSVRQMARLGAALCALTLGACGADTTPPASAARVRVKLSEPGGVEVSGAVWEIRALDRTSDGLLWALTNGSLYTLRDGEQAWQRAADLEYGYRSMDVFDDSSGAMLNSRWGADLWNAAESSVTPIEFLHERSAGVGDRHGETWFAFFGEQPIPGNGPVTTAGRPTFGPGVNATVVCSMDRGQSWAVIDQLEGTVVTGLSLEDDGTLTFLLGGLGVRKGPLGKNAAGLPIVDMRTIVQPLELDPLPDTALCEWIFMDGELGWIYAQGHHSYAGGRTFRTSDDGATWELESKEDRGYFTMYRLGDGRRLRRNRYLDDGWRWRLDVWDGKRFVPFDTPPGIESEKISRSRVTASGDLLVLLRTGPLWIYETNSNAWRQLWTEPPGGAIVAEY